MKYGHFHPLFDMVVVEVHDVAIISTNQTKRDRSAPVEREGSNPHMLLI